MTVQVFPFNPFSENTILVFDETKEAVLFDPGCWDDAEKAKLADFVEKNGLKITRLINTHCHLDHVFGNRWASERWKLPLEAHRLEEKVLASFEKVCQMYGIPVISSQPEIGRFIEHGDLVSFGKTTLRAILTPGHSPGSLCFFEENEAVLIGGDVLFFESIGRTDLPGGNHETLLASIRERIFTLPGETLVYPGHGPTTTVRHEMEYNPFL